MTSGVYQAWAEKVRSEKERGEYTFVELMQETPVENASTAASNLATAFSYDTWPSFRVIWALEKFTGSELAEAAADAKRETVTQSARGKVAYEEGLQWRKKYRGREETPEQRRIRKAAQLKELYAKDWAIATGQLVVPGPKNPKNYADWLRFFDEIRAATGIGTKWNRRELCRKHGLQDQYISQLLTRKRAPTDQKKKQALEAIAQEVLGHGIEEEE